MGGDGAVLEGSLCCNACGRQYPVSDGILRAMPSRLLAEQKREIRARDDQVDQYEAMWYLNLFGLVEIPMTLRRLAIEPACRVLEAGCGTGRMTSRIAAAARDLVSIDFSYESLRVTREKGLMSGAKNIDLVQADLCNLPFKDCTFDRVVSCQVLEHIPGDEARSAAIEGLARVARQSGRVVVSAYQHTVFTSVKQGEHDGGIPFFRFTRPELEALLSAHLRVDSITGSLVYIHLAQCSKEA